MNTLPVVAYHLCDLVTGTVLEDLPLTGEDEVQNTVAREDTTTFTLNPYDPRIYIPGQPVTWDQALVPRKAMIVQSIDTGAGPVPVQGWVVTDVETGASTVALSCSTLEHCLAHCYLDDDVSLTDDETTIAATVLAAGQVGPKFGFTVTAVPAGRSGDADYTVTEDRTILDILTERMAGDGAEWRIHLAWHDGTRRAVDKIIDLAGTIGLRRPDAIFDLDTAGRGAIDSYTRKTSGGPTRLVGATEGTGSERIVTDPITAIDLVANGWPVFEERATFTDLTDLPLDADIDATLAQRTRARLDATKLGTTVWSVVGNEDAPRPGVDFDPGDTVYLDVAPQIPTDPTGGSAWVRVLGYRLNTRSLRVTPILWEDADAAS